MVDDEKNKEAERRKAATREKVKKGIPITDPEEALNGGVALDGRLDKDGKPMTVDNLNWKGGAKEGDNNESIKEGAVNDVKKALKEGLSKDEAIKEGMGEKEIVDKGLEDNE